MGNLIDLNLSSDNFFSGKRSAPLKSLTSDPIPESPEGGFEAGREWDIERTLGVNASIVTLLGVGLGATVNRKFFILPAIAGVFLMLHALEGWCPPVPVLRRIGIRTMSEIYFEKFALKALRGDFENVPRHDGEQKLEEAVAAVQK